MATPYDTRSLPRTFSTPANSRKDYTTLPDQHMQTTAKDIGLILEWIVQCSKRAPAPLLQPIPIS